MITKKEHSKKQIAQIENRIKNYENDYLKFEEKVQALFAQGNRESRSISNIIKIMTSLQDEIQGARALIKVYQKDLEEIS